MDSVDVERKIRAHDYELEKLVDAVNLQMESNRMIREEFVGMHGTLFEIREYLFNNQKTSDPGIIARLKACENTVRDINIRQKIWTPIWVAILSAIVWLIQNWNSFFKIK